MNEFKKEKNFPENILITKHSLNITKYYHNF